MPRTIATLMSARAATLHELDTVYGLRDMWDMLEQHSVDTHNQKMMQKHNERPG